MVPGSLRSQKWQPSFGNNGSKDSFILGESNRVKRIVKAGCIKSPSFSSLQLSPASYRVGRRGCYHPGFQQNTCVCLSRYTCFGCSSVIVLPFGENIPLYNSGTPPPQCICQLMSLRHQFLGNSYFVLTLSAPDWFHNWGNPVQLHETNILKIKRRCAVDREMLTWVSMGLCEHTVECVH